MANKEASHRLLVVDDEAELRSLLQRYLTNEGYQVAAVEDGAAMTRHLKTHHVDLIILDLMLPGEDGLSLARNLRSQGNQPIIIISARGEEMDRIIGLEVGADDYLSKPFNPRELLARIRAVLRRMKHADQPMAAVEKSVLEFGPFALDVEKYRLTREGDEIPLTHGEFTLLRVFLEHSDRVLSRDMLMEITKGYERSHLDRSIDVCVNRLRRKIEPNPSEPIYLRTVWGAGYLFSRNGE
ncbi:response regulator [endosymbiont of Ridgeia piscesae]|jgi:DNA-binding response OmpR family regulator|uniref:DNA-binding response regulator, OmpR family n=1 Tax=endosymbiont of Ridgeia piscesae TaxID=54398 RepID=A0A0T5ZA34_9GAMM|nr:response regulator [endosymbiont of Ridgeia piscesae]KRT55211.1 DNA-binding response regulator, OmpR family [endosymbiont of Ridgeia piscesae]KRT59635.1 two-component system, OmpR family, phosphate regulon response regulator OmpR [endosymbiont of Ridgeia piscesae]